MEIKSWRQSVYNCVNDLFYYILLLIIKFLVNICLSTGVRRRLEMYRTGSIPLYKDAIDGFSR